MASTSPVSPINTIAGRLLSGVSMGMKLFVLTVLTLILSLFAIWINGLVEERTGRKVML